MDSFFEVQEIHSRIIENGRVKEAVDLTKTGENGKYVLKGKEFVNGKTRNIYMINAKKKRGFRTPKKVHFDDTVSSQKTRKRYPYSLRKQISSRKRGDKK
jgi:hypothetical protein